MLSRVSESRSALSRRTVAILLAVGVSAFALPTLQIRPAAAEPAGAPTADKKPLGRLFLSVLSGTDDAFESTIIAVDPTTGKWQRICEAQNAYRTRVSPNREMLAFAKHKEGVWTCAAQKDSSPGRIFDRGAPSAWSPDSKQIIVTDGNYEEGKGWKHETWRMNADGTDAIKLPVPESDEVSDWSTDGKWLVTVSDRHEPKGSGYQLYVMKPDGTQERRITQGRGLNVYARFSPDSSKVAYLHQEKSVNSLWVVNLDGTGGKEILKEEGVAGIEAVCWSPDGKQLAVSRFDWELEDGKKIRHAGKDHRDRIEIVDADGKNGKELKLDDLKIVGLGHPDWR